MVISKSMEDLVRNSSVIRQLFEEGIKMAQERGAENVFDFSLGNPSVPAPAKVRDSVLEILENEDSLYVHGYMKNAGYDEVRNNVASYLNEEFGKQYTADNILMTCGAAGGLNCILRALLNNDDEVVCFAPFFGEYRSYIANYGGKTVTVPANTETFQLNLSDLPALLNERTKAVILNSPNNPTGVVYSAETLSKLQGILAEAEARIGHPIYVICDEPYRELVYDGVEVPFMPDYIKNTIVGTSFSKTLSLPGERIGYLLIPDQIDSFEEITSALICANRVLGYVNAPSLFQLVASRCLRERCDIEAYDRNRKLLYETLTKLGFTCVKPQGAFYLFVKSPVEDEKEFVNEGKKLGIIMVGAGSWGCPGYVRIAYCVKHDMIERSIPAFEKLAAKYFG